VRIIIETIKHEDQAYDTVGNWTYDKDGTLHIYVSQLEEDTHSFLVGIHECIEAWLCRLRGIAEQDVTDFDVAYEAARPEGDLSEPGDSPKAPYCREHCFAENIERLLALEMGISWPEYNDGIEEL